MIYHDDDSDDCDYEYGDDEDNGDEVFVLFSRKRLADRSRDVMIMMKVMMIMIIVLLLFYHFRSI